MTFSLFMDLVFILFRYFTQKSAATWWVHPQRLPGAYAGVSASSWSLYWIWM